MIFKAKALRSTRWLGFRWRSTVLRLVLALGSALLFMGIATAQVPSSPLSVEERLPQPQVHVLPASLAMWHDSQNSGDYFADVQPVRVGYLVWSRFPIRVYVEPSVSETATTSQFWTDAVMQAVQEWGAYLPLEIVPTAETADIAIWRSSPPLQIGNTPDRQRPPSLRARSAETRYEVYVDRQSEQPILSHRFTILLRPNQTVEYIRAAARHELGHALGIWGHSPSEGDVMYFSQVRTPPSISARDINTLKRVYEQPTRLGWVIPD